MDPAEVVMEEAKARQQPIVEATARGDSKIQQFFRGTTVFVTGGTGFLGKLLIEKLIRACDVKKVFVLIRPKKGMSIGERIRVLLNDSAFDTLRELQPDFVNKVVPLEGDISEVQLGFSDQDFEVVTDKIDVVIHMAATTRFDESLQRATLINVRGTREVLNLAKKCKNLKSFVHVSTAFCQATPQRSKSDVLEHFYSSPIEPDVLIRMAETMGGNKLVSITAKLIDGWPNTYTFTKAVAEELIRTNEEHLPVCVVRPPIVLCSYLEPSPGWIDPACVYGAPGWYITTIVGFCHVVLKADIHLCVTPADYVTNAVIASAPETCNRYDKGDKEIKIYSISSGKTIHIDFCGKYMRTEEYRSFASPKSVWYCWVVETSNKFIYWLLFWLLHYIPAYLVDTVLFLLRIKLPLGVTSIVKVYTKIYNMNSVLSYFLTNEWFFKDDNTTDMYNSLSATDKVLFNFDVKSIDWSDYLIVYGLGLRKYIIKDGLNNTDKGVRMQFWFKIGNFIFFTVYAYVIFKIFYTLFTMVQFVN